MTVSSFPFVPDPPYGCDRLNIILVQFRPDVFNMGGNRGIITFSVQTENSLINLFPCKHLPFIAGKKFTDHILAFGKGSYCVADGRKYYQYTAVDECSRWTYREMYDEHSTYSSKDFLLKLMERAPFPIREVQTDNRSEFTNRLFSDTVLILLYFTTASGKKPAKYFPSHRKMVNSNRSAG